MAPLAMREVDSEERRAEHASTLSNHLHSRLADGTDGVCHLLFDAQAEPLASDAPLGEAFATIEQSTATPARCLIRLPEQAVARARWPWLTRLDTTRALGSLALQASVHEALAECDVHRQQRGHARRIGGWLVSPEPTTIIASHFARTLLQRDGVGRPVQLRACNPAVTWPLFHMLRPEQQAALLGPIRRWWLLDPAGAPVPLNNPQPTHVPVGEPLRLDPEQWADVAGLGAFSAAVGRWMLTLAAPPRPDDVARQAGVALQALRRARSHGLDDAEDWTCFAWQALNVHSAFDRHPVVKQLLARKFHQKQVGSLVPRRVDIGI